MKEQEMKNKKGTWKLFVRLNIELQWYHMIGDALNIELKSKKKKKHKTME